MADRENDLPYEIHLQKKRKKQVKKMPTERGERESTQSNAELLLGPRRTLVSRDELYLESSNHQSDAVNGTAREENRGAQSSANHQIVCRNRNHGSLI
ncbi:hypothetical protein Baya_11786 [Bagarius yarrelli]|uniref:Uncharacterized protein n=1 Tax=Bagarius yarrelli TaxID=175774 RepID=A0A556V134_BAGYA|nr:hypothetical protein Baya_11786 [Bagarius yarrelli]